MSRHLTATMRHGRLFDLLHDQSRGESVAERLRARAFARKDLDAAEAEALRALALASWANEPPAGADTARPAPARPRARPAMRRGGSSFPATS